MRDRSAVSPSETMNSGTALDIGKFNRRNGEHYPGKGLSIT